MTLQPKERILKKAWAVFLPLAIVALAVAVTLAMEKFLAKEPEKNHAPPIPPTVHAVRVVKKTMRLEVASQGTVVPSLEAVVSCSVDGQVVDIDPRLVAGGRVAAGETLVRLNPSPLLSAVAQATAAQARAEAGVVRLRAQAEQARREWERLAHGPATDLALQLPQLREAEAELTAARALRATALDNLDHADIKALIGGMVKAKEVRLGQHVVAGATLATLVSLGEAEVRLPVRTADLAFLEGDFLTGELPADRRPLVTLTADLAGRLQSWQGEIIRGEGLVTPESRQLFLVARVIAPYQPGEDRAVLPFGLFVQARIVGRLAEGVVVLPPPALLDGHQVFVVDEDSRLRRRTVQPLRVEKGMVIVEKGLEHGDMVCIRPPEFMVEGVEVKVVEEKTAVMGGGHE